MKIHVKAPKGKPHQIGTERGWTANEALTTARMMFPGANVSVKFCASGKGKYASKMNRYNVYSAKKRQDIRSSEELFRDKHVKPATPKLTASQREYLAINGFVMVKRGGKYVRITG